MADFISTQDLINVKQDIEDIGLSVNTDGVITPRYGPDYDSLPKVIREMIEQKNLKLSELQLAIDTALAASVGAAGWVASLVVDSSGQTQQQINNGIESISSLSSISSPLNGNRVFVKSYHAGLNKGGGTFVYNSSKSAINDGVVTFNGWVRASFLFIDTFMAGCVADGVTDDTVALQRAVDYTAQNGFSLYLSEGVHYLATATFKRWGMANQYQTYCPIIDVKYSNTSIIAKSEKSVLKYGDEVTYTAFSEVGYVGAQLFAADPTVTINNFELIDVFVDGNGYENKILGLNGGGTAAGNQAVFIQKGNNTQINGCTFKDLSGYQVLNIGYQATNTLVENNTFLNAGWLDGANWTAGYTDQSTIYLGGTYTCRNNNLIQSTAGMFAGTAFELHGFGLTFGNTIQKYAAAFLSAAVVNDANNKTIGNNVIDCTILQSTDTQNSLNNSVTVMGNYFRQNTQKNPAGSVYDLYRTMFYFLGFNSPANCSVEISNNTLDTDGLYIGSTDAYLKTNNSIVYAAQVTSFSFTNNTVKNHKGSFMRLARQKAGVLYSISNNTFDNCGVDNSTDFGNSLVFYDNDNDQSYGVRPSSIEFNNNTFKACKYGQYVGSSLDVAGVSIMPYKITVDNDVHDSWLGTIRIKPTFDIASDVFMDFNYKVTSIYNAAKDINFYVSGYAAASQRGDIKFLENGVSKSYTKTNNDYLWFKLNNGLIQIQVTYDPPSIAANTQIEYVFNGIVGAELGMTATPTFDKFLSGVQMWAQVTASQQVVVYFRNGTGTAIDLPSGLIKVVVK